MRRLHTLALWMLLWAAGGCVAAFDPQEIPAHEDYVVLVKSARLPSKTGFLISQAHHTWLELKRGSEDEWELLEVLSNEAFTNELVLSRHWISAKQVRRLKRWKHDVHLHQVISGPEAEGLIHEVEELAAGYEDARNYRGWPGPNSNTFVEYLARNCSALDYEPHHNAVGKDWAPFVVVGPSTSGTGVELETPLFGVQLGLHEGIEVHFLQLTFGIDLFPPALKLPFLPRLGF